MTSMLDWHSLTLLGDSMVLLPGTAGIAAWLAWLGRWRLAAYWLLLAGGALALVLASKLAFAGWGIGIRALDFTGFSGHAMRACAVYPVLAMLAGTRLRPPRRTLLVLGGWLLGLAIALSRVVLHDHSVSEALAGALLGAAVALSFLQVCRPAPRAPALLLATALLALLPGAAAAPAPTRLWVERLALALSGHAQPYERERWLAGDYLP